MTSERYWELEGFYDGKLTEEEVKEGWHFCPDWDGLLVGPGMSEHECCTCRKGGSK